MKCCECDNDAINNSVMLCKQCIEHALSTDFAEEEKIMSNSKKHFNMVRIHNRNETLKHFTAKAIATKILFDCGYQVQTEYEMPNKRVADIFSEKKNEKLILEFESRKNNGKAAKFLEDYNDINFIVFYLEDLSDDIDEMEKELRYKIGL